MATPWPELRTLELLLATAQLGSLTRAAEQVGMAQPNASRAIRRLETHVGMRLLERGSRGSTLTPQGRLVAEWAAPVLEHARAWRTGIAALGDAPLGDERLRAPGDGQARTLDVVASQTIAEYLAPRWLGVFRARFPDVAATLRVHNSATAADLVRAGQCALGFVEGPDAPAGLARQRVRTDRLAVVVSPGHPWAHRRRPLPLATLATTPLVVREEGSGTRDTYARAVAGLPTAPPSLVLSSNAAVLGSAAVGAAPAVLSELAVAAAVAAGRVVAVGIDRPDALTRPLRAVWRRDVALAPPAQAFLGIALADSAAA